MYGILSHMIKDLNINDYICSFLNIKVKIAFRPVIGEYFFIILLQFA